MFHILKKFFEGCHIGLVLTMSLCCQFVCTSGHACFCDWTLWTRDLINHFGKFTKFTTLVHSTWGQRWTDTDFEVKRSTSWRHQMWSKVYFCAILSPENINWW